MLGEAEHLTGVSPHRGKYTRAVQQAAPEANVVAAYQNLPAAALADLDRELRADVLICGDDADAVSSVLALTSTIAGLDPIDAGALANAAGVEALTAILLNVNRVLSNEEIGAMGRVAASADLALPPN